MQTTEIFEALSALVVERYGTPAAPLEPGTRQSDLAIDSILMLDLLMDIEDRFGFRFRSMELPRDPALSDLVALIESSLAAARPGH
ncbi:MAG TPA: acyl carrier protein [Thermomonas sp.]|nr:acyl carrier protein [Thermomonas sp.]